MNDDRLPAETEPPISEDLRQRGIDILQELLAGGKVDLDRFQAALDGLLGARTHADFASVIRSLPPPVAFTPAARRRQEPLKVSASMDDVRLKGRWQVGRLTKISTGMGAVTIDLTEAEFDDWDVKIVVWTGMGSITVIAPRGLDVRQVGRECRCQEHPRRADSGLSRGAAQRILWQGDNPPDASEGETTAPLGMAPATQWAAPVLSRPAAVPAQDVTAPGPRSPHGWLQDAPLVSGRTRPLDPAVPAATFTGRVESCSTSVYLPRTCWQGR